MEDCGYAMVWIGYADDDEDKTVRPVAHAGFEEGYLEMLNVTWADTERGRGPTGTAIRTGLPSTCRNMLTDPLFAPWREQAIKRGYSSSIVFPLLAAGIAFGAITIYSREPDPFSTDEVKLLDELADDLAYGITVIRIRTAHEQAKEALKDSEERYHSLFRAMTEGFAIHEIITDEKDTPVDYRFLDINPAFERLTGLNRADVIGRTLNEVLPGDDAKWVQMYGRVALTGEPVQFENYSPALKRHYEVLAYRPAPRQFAVIFMDITERKQVQKEIEKSMARFRSVLDGSRDVIYRLNMQTGRFEYISPACEAVVGYSPDEIMALSGEARFQMVHPDDLAAMQAAVARLEETGREEVEYRQRTKSGDYRWISNHMSLTGDGAAAVSRRQHPRYHGAEASRGGRENHSPSRSNDSIESLCRCSCGE